MSKAMNKAADRHFHAVRKLMKATSPRWKSAWSSAAKRASLEYLTLEAIEQSARAGARH